MCEIFNTCGPVHKIMCTCLISNAVSSVLVWKKGRRGIWDRARDK